MAQQWIEGRVIERIDWTDRLHSLRIEAQIEPFRAGQFTKLGLQIGDEIVGRPYSIVSTPGDPVLEFYFSTVNEGPLSPRLSALKAGDAVQVAPKANGFLVLDEVPPAIHLWLVATGTGLGPFLSILKTPEPWQRFQRVVLVHAARTAAELTYRRTIASVAEAEPKRFSYIPFLSRETADYALAGRIPQAITEGQLEARAALRFDPAQCHVMLCGNPAMVEDATAALAARGLRKHRRKEPGQISMETYW
ncbi:MAG: ferredoxin--NADP reductase [Rhodocyclaceae bacterium]|nr:ferredoxin--NADP reductase [Rhodocyclaceae bacterium]MCP5297073.1 ferredoxin--NADP reductase [Zoogloeaceae bacterium]PKO66204.1 MAG: ferredoxin--NADP(+) reductase [Betaproteobacteria bacterium HGW-Betaproteobacteria-14]MBX3676868.1 ferredoxin--NADP reductase [Rhodocyclaceae bacterium]MCB1891067.1 ferredoxin--NADP reductase [Rhodocyclaceae bacterium]